MSIKTEIEAKATDWSGLTFGELAAFVDQGRAASVDEESAVEVEPRIIEDDYVSATRIVSLSVRGEQ